MDKEFYTWHLNVCEKITPLLLKGKKIATEKIANGEKGWVLNNWLKNQDYELYEEWIVVQAVMNLHNDTVPNEEDMQTCMEYYVDCNSKAKKIPYIIETLFSQSIQSYLSKESKTLDQAFMLKRKKGGQAKSNRLTPEVQGITKHIIENELELMEAINEYQQNQIDDTDEETSTETLRTMFHEQKADALMSHIIASDMNGNTISDKAKNLIGEYWDEEQDVLKIGTNRKES